MTAEAGILVATEVVADADLVRKLLQAEFANVVVSTQPDRSVEDFERHRPAVLILACNSLEKAERYYLGLYRRSSIVHGLPHRTIILCNKDDLLRVYELCKKSYFDDYILFWPMTHDTTRLPMAVHHALWRLADAKADVPTAGDIATQARPLLELETRLEQYAAKGNQGIAVATNLLRQTQQEIGGVLERFSRRLSDGELRGLLEDKDTVRVQREFNRLRTEEFDKRLATIASALQPVSDWATTLKQEFAPQLKAASVLRTMAKGIRPVVLVVDDDEFQHKLLAQLLAAAGLEVISATSGTEALAALGKRRPDLIVMDINLPDIDGIEVTSRLKSVEQFAGIPVVMITGQSEKNVVVESLKAGASDFVVKPFDREILLAKVRSFLNIGSPM